jgi:hypothetical protein
VLSNIKFEEECSFVEAGEKFKEIELVIEKGKQDLMATSEIG